MTCDQTQPLLEAFADGELGWGAAWRVRHHLAGCPACASELAELRQLAARIRAWRDIPAPAHLQSQIAAALPSATPAFLPRRPITARRAAVGLAGIAAATAAFFWLIPGQPGQPTIAFADVERAMQQVQIVSYDQSTQVYDAQGRVVPEMMTDSLHFWLRRSPAAISCFNQGMSQKTLTDERGVLFYDLRTHSCLKRPPNLDVARFVEHQLNELVDAPTDADVLANPALGWTFTPWQQQKVTLNGAACWKFTRTITHPISDDTRGTISRRHGVTQGNIWVDAKTLRVVHVENDGDAPFISKGHVERTVFDNFHYNETPPPGVFDWSPPAGAKVEGHW